MGCVKTITATTWPEQTHRVGSEVKVCFHYDTSNFIVGRILREDAEAPFETLIALDEGRIVRAVECQYQ